jgi:hypothetical protein
MQHVGSHKLKPSYPTLGMELARNLVPVTIGITNQFTTMTEGSCHVNERYPVHVIVFIFEKYSLIFVIVTKPVPVDPLNTIHSLDPLI